MIVIAGKSGSGKNTILNYLLKENPKLDFVKSCTTRPKRDGEVDGKDFDFLSEEEFRNLLEQDKFAEFSNNYGHLYGTFKEDLNNPNKIKVIELNGIKELKRKGYNIVVIYVEVNIFKRFTRMIKRGDGIFKALKRIILDEFCFKGIEKQADIVFDNNTFSRYNIKMLSYELELKQLIK